MLVLIVEPGQAPVPVAIKNELAELQSIVGGYIEVTQPFADNIAVICNEEGKLLGLPANRSFYDFRGVLRDTIVGTFVIAGIAGDEFCSLSPAQILRYTKLFEVLK